MTHHQNMSKKIIVFNSIIFFILITGCKKLVDINPPSSSITSTNLFVNNASAASAMTGIYSNMINPGAGFSLSDASNSISFNYGLASDELTNYSSDYDQFYQNALVSSPSGATNSYWKEIYQQIHIANVEIAGLQTANGVTAAMKKQLDGEAKFIRAFYNFYAVNIFGDIPLVTSTDYRVNNTIKRSSKAEVYQLIVKDLQDAATELSPNFVDASGNVTTERIRPNKGTAQALLARVFLYYNNNWAGAAAQADSVISNTATYSLLPDLTQVFKMNNKEAIWQLQVNQPGYNTQLATYFVLTAAPGSSAMPVSLSQSLINSFEPNDLRFESWVGQFQDGSVTYYYPYKYKEYLYGDPVSEYLMVFRLAEQYLIRAEARAELGDISGAQSDLNIIRSRAGLPNTKANDKASLLTAILNERRIELFTEWGDRWFDLIRTNNINSVMGSPGNVCQAKGGSWNPDWILAPIPQAEIQINPNLRQNSGY